MRALSAESADLYPKCLIKLADFFFLFFTTEIVLNSNNLLIHIYDSSLLHTYYIHAQSKRWKNFFNNFKMKKKSHNCKMSGKTF